MEKLFYFLFVFALINISTQFFYELENDEFYASNTTPNPLVVVCGEKINKTKHTVECVDEAQKLWYPNATWNSTGDTDKTNRTECCYTWDYIDCFKPCWDALCTPQEVRESKAYVEWVINNLEYTTQECKQWPYLESQKICHSKEKMFKNDCK
jgi:hypothetical protein